MFTLIRETDSVKIEKINALVYGQPGAGKTTLAFTAKNPILLDVDNGAHRAQIRRDHIKIESWSDINNNFNQFIEAISGYQTVVIDTVDKLLRLMMTTIKQNNPKIKDGRMLYGMLKEVSSTFLTAINSVGADVIMVAHESEKETPDGDSTIRAQITGGTAGIVIELADIAGRMYFKDGKRVIDFKPNDSYFTKDAGIGLYTIPLDDEETMARLIDKAKQEFEDRVERRLQRKAEAEVMINKIKDIDNIDDLNAIIPQIKAAPESLKALYRSHVANKASELQAVLKGATYVQSVSVPT